MIKFLGYCMIGFAGCAMRCAGLWFDQWEYWAILLGFIIGEFLVCKGGK